MKHIFYIAVLLASLTGFFPVSETLFCSAADDNSSPEGVQQEEQVEPQSPQDENTEAADENAEAADNSESPALPPIVRPALSDVFGPYEQWLAGLNVSQEVQNGINQYRQQVTQDMDEGLMLEVLTSMVIAADSRYSPLFEENVFLERIYPVEQLTALTKAEGTPEWIVNVMNLQAARRLANNGFYDDAAALIQDLKPESSPCPATLLFYQGLVKYQSLDPEAAIPILNRLIAMDLIPDRYRELAQRMIWDMEKLKPKSLDHISRRMGDVAGRLGNGRANEKTVEIEDGIVKDLDEQIKKLEEQLQQMMQQMSAQSQPQPPMGEQAPSRMAGKGRVDNKKVGDSADWGNLPEKERERDLQQIQENFPPHYRDIIEQYFKRMSETEY